MPSGELDPHPRMLGSGDRSARRARERTRCGAVERTPARDDDDEPRASSVRENEKAVMNTPSAISTIFNAYLDGFIEAPSNASVATVNIMALTGNASDALTVKRGSFCRIY